MTPTKIRERLAELDGAVDPEAYAAALFYVHGDEAHFAACRRSLDGGGEGSRERRRA